MVVGEVAVQRAAPRPRARQLVRCQSRRTGRDDLRPDLIRAGRRIGHLHRAETRLGAGRDTSRIRKMIPSLAFSASAAVANHPGACCWNDHAVPSAATWRRPAARNAVLAVMSSVLIRCDASRTTPKRRPSVRSWIRAHTSVWRRGRAPASPAIVDGDDRVAERRQRSGVPTGPGALGFSVSRGLSRGPGRVVHARARPGRSSARSSHGAAVRREPARVACPVVVPGSVCLCSARRDAAGRTGKSTIGIPSGATMMSASKLLPDHDVCATPVRADEELRCVGQVSHPTVATVSVGGHDVNQAEWRARVHRRRRRNGHRPHRSALVREQRKRYGGLRGDSAPPRRESGLSRTRRPWCPRRRRPIRRT